MDDRELSRMVSLESIAQRYADEAAALRSTLAACNEVAATYKAELQRFREREPLVQEMLRWIAPVDDGEARDELPKFWRSFLDGLDGLTVAVLDFGPCITSASADASIADDLTSGNAPDSTKSLDKVSDEC